MRSRRISCRVWAAWFCADDESIVVIEMLLNTLLKWKLEENAEDIAVDDLFTALRIA